MKHNRVLNRPMFNPNNSAYGRGITTNLVTEQERQKFNTGGRVGLAKGTGWFNFAPSDVENIQRLPSGEIDYDFYEQEDLKVPTSWAEKILPMHPFHGREEMEKKFFEGGREHDAARKWWDESGFFPGKKGWFGRAPEPDKVEVIDDVQEDIYDKQLVSKPEVIDEESDVIDWTPEEKEEKKGQIQLALAERLIGGARDPLGSTKQQKNLAGMFGDIRKITDKEDLRKWKRRYDAEADAYMKKMGSVNKMGRDYMDYKHQGLQPVEALNRMTDISAKTITRQPKDKDIKSQYKGLGPGDVIYDENDGGWYVIKPNGDRKNVTITDIIEADKKGVLKEWKETKITLKS